MRLLRRAGCRGHTPLAAIMPAMSASRIARRLIARCLLVWFALALGVAAASPWVSPRAYQLVCAEGAVKLVAVDEAPANAPHGHQLDCALCLLTGSPPPEAAIGLPGAGPRGHTVSWVRTDAPRVAGVWAPLPARGPPALQA